MAENLEPKWRKFEGEFFKFPGDMSDAEIDNAMADAMGASISAQKQSTSTAERPREMSTQNIAGSPVPSTTEEFAARKDLTSGMAESLRTGVPLASAIVLPSTAALRLAAITFGSELAAGELEEVINHPEYQTGMEALKRQGEIVKDAAISGGLSYYGDRYLLPWVGEHANKMKNFLSRPLMKQTLGRMIKPKGGFAPDVETAQRFLGRTYVARGEKPFSLTLDQLHQGQKTLIDTMGSISRSSFGGGRVMRQSDLRNAEAVTQWVDNFLSSAEKTDPRTFGNMMKGMMNKDLHFVETETNALYDAFRETAFGKGIEVNFGDAFDVLRSNSDSRFARSALAKIVSSNPRIRAAIDAGDELLMKTPDEIQAIFEGWPTEKIDEVLDTMANSLPLEHAVDLYHNLNRMIKKGSEKGMRRSVNQFKGELDNALKESLGETAYGQFQKANEFTARHGERIHQSIMETIFKKIGDKKPSGIIGLFSGGQAADTMTVVKDFFRSSDALNMQDFEETVRQPLRHWFLSRAIDKETGIVSGAKLARTLDNLERRAGPEFLKEVFGPNAPQALREAATTLNLLSKSSEANIFVKIVQAGALSGATMGLMYGTGQPIERIVGGGAAVLVAPWALSKLMANPKLVRTLTDGFIAGPGTSKFARSILMVGNTNREYLFKKNLSGEAREFYDRPWEEEPPEQQINWPVTERMLQPPPLS